MVAEFTPRFSAAPNLPPQNVDTEESLLGAILLDPEAIRRVADQLHPEAFYIDAHRLIYKAALELHKQGQPVDLMTVATWLYDHKKLEKVGGQSRLVELVSQTVSSANVDRYAELITDKFLRRQLIQAGNDIIQFGYETFRKLPEVFTEAKERLSALMDTPLLSGESPDQFAYNKLCLEIQQIELGVSDPGLRLWKLQELAQQYKRSVKQLEALYFMSLLKEENESLLTWKELSDRYGDQVREWLLHGFLPKGVVIALHAKGGVGKTRLAYDMLHTLLTGGSWNGFPTTGSRKAIVIQTDESAGDMLDALRKRGFDENLDNVRYKTRWTFEHIPQLMEEIQEFQPEVIVMDSITSMSRHSLFSENDVQYARPILKLKDLAQMFGCAIILIHHSSKAGEARGTSAIFNSVSEVWKLEKDSEDKSPDNTKRLLTIEKSRSRRPTTYRLDFEPENASWNLLGEIGISENNPDLNTKGRITQFLLEHANIRFEAQEIAHEIDGAAPRIRILLAQLANDGIISLIRSKKGRANLYFIAHEPDRLPDRPLDHLPDRPQKFEGGDRPPDHLHNPEFIKTSALGDRPAAKNTSTEERNDPNFADRPITLATESPEPSNINKNKVIALGDRLGDRPPQGDQVPSWTKSVFAAVKADQTIQGFPKNSKYQPPTAPFSEGDWVEYTDEHDGGIYRVESSTHTHARLKGLKNHVNVAFLVPTESPKAELSDEDLEDGSQQPAVPVSAQNRPLPYTLNNLPKKGDLIRCKDGIPGQIIEVRAKKYEILWKNGRKAAYDFRDLEIMDCRREN